MADAAYVHLPFCRRRCFYCDFPISVIGNKTEPDRFRPIEEYVGRVREEIERTPIEGKPLRTIFFGGGTPSLVPDRSLAVIIDCLAGKFGLSPDIEISMEIDPATFPLDRLRGYVRAGVNRLSLGAQAFQDHLLEICGRSHRVADIYQAVDFIHRVGVENFSLDLISGLPHQTRQDWESSLEKAIELQPKHLSCYDLVLESVTPFGKQYKPGEKPLPDDETTAEMYKMASERLREAGYDHYEISNYARSGFQCRHNRVYWENRPYYGFGMGAASYTGGKRFTRPRTRKEYFDWVRDGCNIEVPETGEIDRLLETLMLGLRLAEGADLRAIEADFGSEVKNSILEVLQPHFRRDLVRLEGDRIRLTDPEGFLFSNRVLTDLFDRFE
ncbi:radical SAM family heme chaperone HemW [Pannus brasiliensis CCIBt3594]|uniref:Heme chaperone HemW n=1 Tax=Pannus brasiliensis CCIBt3594 TaxID=1427578 RepID=A0AAW9QWU3_9CHRO